MKQLSIEDGLPKSTLSAVRQDFAGFIWLGPQPTRSMHGDRLIVMTDALIENQLESGKMYGVRRFVKFMTQNLEQNMQ